MKISNPFLVLISYFLVSAAIAGPGTFAGPEDERKAFSGGIDVVADDGLGFGAHDFIDHMGSAVTSEWPGRPGVIADSPCGSALMGSDTVSAMLDRPTERAGAF